MRCLTVVCFLSLAFTLRADEPKNAWDAIDRYAEEKIDGWRVLVHKSLHEKENDEIRTKTLKLLDFQLYQITRVVPAGPLEKLQKIPIWVEKAHPRHPCMCYHIS